MDDDIPSGEDVWAYSPGPWGTTADDAALAPAEEFKRPRMKSDLRILANLILALCVLRAHALGYRQTLDLCVALVDVGLPWLEGWSE